MLSRLKINSSSTSSLVLLARESMMKKQAGGVSDLDKAFELILFHDEKKEGIWRKFGPWSQ